MIQQGAPNIEQKPSVIFNSPFLDIGTFLIFNITNFPPLKPYLCTNLPGLFIQSKMQNPGVRSSLMLTLSTHKNKYHCWPYLVVVKFATAVKISLVGNAGHFLPGHFITSLQKKPAQFGSLIKNPVHLQHKFYKQRKNLFIFFQRILSRNRLQQILI